MIKIFIEWIELYLNLKEINFDSNSTINFKTLPIDDDVAKCCDN